MKKLLIGWALTSALTACGGTAEKEPNIVTDEEGNSIIIQDGENISTEPNSYSDDNPKATPMGAGCWVVLDYCRDPRYGGYPTCHQNGQCTDNQVQEACTKLYRKLC